VGFTLVVHDFVAAPPGAFGVPLVVVLVVHDFIAVPPGAFGVPLVVVLVVHYFIAVPPGAFGVPLVVVLVAHDRVATPRAAYRFTGVRRDALVVVRHFGPFLFGFFRPIILDISTNPGSTDFEACWLRPWIIPKRSVGSVTVRQAEHMPYRFGQSSQNRVSQPEEEPPVPFAAPALNPSTSSGYVKHEQGVRA
jgi:hypothetical protein